MQKIKITTCENQTVEITTDELLTKVLEFCRQHFSQHNSTIDIGENADLHPEFTITPVIPKKPEFKAITIKLKKPKS